MKGLRTVIGAVVMVAGMIPSMAGAQVDRWECDDLEDYRLAMIEALPEDSEALMVVMESEDVMEVRPRTLAKASDELDEWATNLEDMPSRDIPKAAEEYHEALVDTIGIMSIVTLYLSEGNMFALMAYTDQMEDVTVEMETAQALGQQRCGTDWPFGDGMDAQDARVTEEVARW